MLEENPAIFFSFELKVTLSLSDYRVCYFQALSNSEWANEGYLVALNIENEKDVLEGINRLSNAFGIGLIKLNPESVADSMVLIPAKPKEYLNWDSIDTLVRKNRDFQDFISDIKEDLELGKVKSQYDKILSDEEMEDHIVKKGIKNKRWQDDEDR